MNRLPTWGIVLGAWVGAQGCDGGGGPSTPAPGTQSDASAGEDAACSAAARAAGTCGQVEKTCEGLEAGKSGVCGTVVDEAGKALANIMVQACTSEICETDKTDDKGYYLIPCDPSERSMKTVGNSVQRVSMNWYQLALAGQPSPASRSITMPLAGTPTALAAATGGTVTLAGGKLEVTAPGNLHYGPGLAEEIAGVAMDSGDLPPYDIEPWKGKEAGTLAFSFYPFPWLETAKDSGTTFSFKADVSGSKSGAVYDVYMADSYDAGKLEKVGTATVAADGKTLASDAGITLIELTTWVLVPR